MINSTNNSSNSNNNKNQASHAAPVVPVIKRPSYSTATTTTTAENGGGGGASSSSSVNKRMSTRKSVLANRREFLARQAVFDKQIFDSSLGCPLASFDDATLALVGGKALQCWKLTKHGFPVPTSFVVPTYVFSLHVGQAGVADMIQRLFTSIAADDWHNDPTVKEAAVDTLTTIRTKIMETPLHPTVVENLKAFLETYLDPGTPVAVRSSGSAEDLADQSFAGQYETHLYQTSLDDICRSIKKCWASMYQPFILDYTSRTSGGETVIKPPQMGVLIMKMVDATAAGVCFTRNLWGADNEVMVEAVRGQGEGLVSGRYVCSKMEKSYAVLASWPFS
jgi:phosphoenolpyruvate synthase/pyruvate phosphate dikinase